MNAIIQHVRTPDELAHQGIRGIDNFTAEGLELLQQKGEAALRRANARLEQRVQARTAELAQANAALQAEIQAHKQVEHERTQLLVREQVLRGELEAAVATLRTSEQRFRRLFEANIIGIAFSDFSGQEIEANDAFLELIGYTREDLQAGRIRWNMMTPPEYRHLDAHAEAELKARGVCAPFEKEYLRKDGHRVPVLIGVARLQNTSEQCVGFALDLSERRRLEAQLRASLQEKEVLLKEMHHRVKNNLQIVASLLNMQADTIEDLSIRTLFEDSQQRIQSIALIHESLYQSGDMVAHVRAADYLPRLSQQLFEAYRSPSDRLILRVHAEPVWLKVATAIPCGLLVTELVTNSFKHAFPEGLMGEIHLTLRQDPPGTCVLIVGDTGVGLPEGLDVCATDSLGWQLVRLLTEQLRGTIELESHEGTTVTITFPL
jgi:PAS domain S-box-containing protein